jgi:hypothetical protein
MVMDYAKPEVMVFVFLAVASIALYSYLSVHSYVNGRRKEREAYYKNETVRRLTESQGAGAGAAIEVIREEDRLQIRRRVESIKLGGLVTVAVGVGVMVFFFFVDHDTREIGVSLGSVPLLVGASLLLYAYALAPKHAE